MTTQAQLLESVTAIEAKMLNKAIARLQAKIARQKEALAITEQELRIYEQTKATATAKAKK